MPAPSDSIVDLLLQLLKNEQSRRSPSLKQTTLLAVGSLIGEVCQYKSPTSAQRVIYGSQSRFEKEKICSRNKKELYKQVYLIYILFISLS